MSSARSVKPNGLMIGYLRKQRGLTIENLSRESDVGTRTVNRAIAGKHVDIETVQILAAVLGCEYSDLVILEHPANKTAKLFHISVDPDNAEDVQAAIAMLSRFLSVGVFVVAASESRLTFGCDELPASPVSVTTLDGKQVDYLAAGKTFYDNGMHPDLNPAWETLPFNAKIGFCIQRYEDSFFDPCTASTEETRQHRVNTDIARQLRLLLNSR